MSSADSLINTIFRVPISHIPHADLMKMIRKVDLGQSETKYAPYVRDISSPITANEFAFVRTYIESTGVKAARIGSNFESYAMSVNKVPQWNGTVCTVGKESKQMSPIPHSVAKEMTQDADEWTAAIASFMFKYKPNKGLVNELSSHAASGPLGALVSDISVTQYNLEMGRTLEKKVGPIEGSEQFAEAVYCMVADSTPAEKNEMLRMTYDLFDKAAISIPASSKRGEKGPITHNPQFTIDWKGYRSNVPRKPESGIFPVGRITKADVKADIITRLPPIGKDVCNIAISNFLMSFPPKLLVFNGYLGTPPGPQREFLERWPFLTVGQYVQPNSNLIDWMDANGLEKQKTFTDDRMHKFKPGKFIILERPYIKEVFQTKAINYGTIQFDEKFWQHYYIVSYRIPDSQKFFYIARDLDGLDLPEDWFGRKKIEIRSPGEFLQAIQTWSSHVLGMFLKGSTWPNVKMYAALKYPMKKQTTHHIVVTELTEDARTSIKEEEKTIKPFMLDGNLDDDEKAPNSEEEEDDVLVKRDWISLATIPSSFVPLVEDDSYVDWYYNLSPAAFKAACAWYSRRYGQAPPIDSSYVTWYDGVKLLFVGCHEGAHCFLAMEAPEPDDATRGKNVRSDMQETVLMNTATHVVKPQSGKPPKAGKSSEPSTVSSTVTIDLDDY